MNTLMWAFLCPKEHFGLEFEWGYRLDHIHRGKQNCLVPFCFPLHIWPQPEIRLG
jgi:hypothetical protein